MLHIGIEAQRIFRPKKHGMDIVALEVIKALQEIDQENQYYIFVKPDEDRYCLKPSDNFKIIELAGMNYVDWELRKLPKAIQSYSLDFMHFTSNTAPPKIDIPYLITLHDIIYLERVSFKGTWYQNLGNLYRKWNVPQAVKESKKLITVSEFEKERILRHFGLPEEFVEVIYNGIGPTFQAEFEEAFLDDVRFKYRLPGSFIFFLGNQAPKKNMPNVLKAYAQYIHSGPSNPLKLVIAETSPSQLKHMLSKAGCPEIDQYIHLTGYVEHKYLAPIYHMSEIFLYPSLRESFGIPIIEGMACATPVITSNTSSMPEVAGDAAYLINPEDPESISQAILDIQHNKKLSVKLQKAGLERVKQFQWKNTAQKTQNLYQKLFSPALAQI